ncbi:MinD-like ATPase involved in chromosome partitioning or flagellar assembly [Sanguibacter gelidistatuariae]|uniref:MinD-like ATPase involved in chromosome partitioning or flagellar assembly n=1 Tax=Sanguibacter gelidistatuariae TaxID=1814289 RepID=A0A1G6VS81_9MICO|nr:hypothetical protein [Sanguibacter gelidistatuariae]SDD56404.1 MinD-like ATPase involved in chromosome partitioning or flagellar assembly [Sanguibacter gelidistatuariae]
MGATVGSAQGDGPLTVLCAVIGPIEATAVAILAGAPGQVDLTRRCADVAEMLAASASGLCRVAVVSADLVGLDRPVVAALHSDGTWVVALCPDDPWQHERMRAIGADAVVIDTEVTTRLLDLVRSVAARAADLPAARGDLGWAGENGLDHVMLGSSAFTHSPGRSPDIDPGHGVGQDGASDGGPADRDGTVVAVWGPTGAPGRSTIALNLAAELVAPPAARRRGRAATPTGDTGLLVDADTYSGALAQMTGLLDESSGIAAACRAAGQGALTLHQLAMMTPSIGPRLRILTGIARAGRWPELSAASLEVVWQECRRLARWTVIDCGFALECDEMLTYDTRAPQRNAATLSALAAADVVVVVGGADVVSVQRLVRALDDLRSTDVGETADPVVVVNRVRASVVGRSPGPVLRETLLRYANVGDVHLVPDDQTACDTALLAGRTLAESAPSSAVRRAITDLAVAVQERAPVAGSPRAGSTSARRPTAAAPWSPTVAH